MQNTEKGRKITTAAVNTSRAVAATSKAVGMSMPNYFKIKLNRIKRFIICRWGYNSCKGSFLSVVEYVPAANRIRRL